MAVNRAPWFVGLGACALLGGCEVPVPESCKVACDWADRCGVLPSFLGGGESAAAARADCEVRCARTEPHTQDDIVDCFGGAPPQGDEDACWIAREWCGNDCSGEAGQCGLTDGPGDGAAKAHCLEAAACLSNRIGPGALGQSKAIVIPTRGQSCAEPATGAYCSPPCAHGPQRALALAVATQCCGLFDAPGASEWLDAGVQSLSVRVERDKELLAELDAAATTSSFLSGFELDGLPAGPVRATITVNGVTPTGEAWSAMYHSDRVVLQANEWTVVGARFPDSPVEKGCTTGEDTDCDGLVGCADPDCPGVTEVCDDGEDNDCDGAADCADPECASTAEDCHDLVDNDCDGLTDCDDPECFDGAKEVVAGGNYTCVRRGGEKILDDIVWCWGDNTRGQLGNQTFMSSPSPVETGEGAELKAVTQLAGGFEHACAIGDGVSRVPLVAQAWCWGANESYQLGKSPDNADKPTPNWVMFEIVGNPARVAAGLKHTCAIMPDMVGDRVWCWGDNKYGQLGNGAMGQPVAIPDLVVELEATSLVATGHFHTCATGFDSMMQGGVWCWGRGDSGQLGNDMTNDYPDPQSVPIPVASQLAAGRAHTCVRDEGAVVLCWGDNSRGQLGVGSGVAQSLVPQPLLDLGSCLSIAVGADHTCALKPDGSLWCWGANDRGQVGVDSGGQDVLTPTQVTGLGASVEQVTAGGAHTCAVLAKNADGVGMVFCWGSNDSGQLGTGSNQPAGSIQPLRARLCK